MDDLLFDWFEEDERPYEIAKRLRVIRVRHMQSPDEVMAYSTDEFSSEVERVEHLLRQGQPIQKASVFRSLSKALCEPGSNRIIETFVQVVPYCDDLTKREAGAGLAKAAKSIYLRAAQADLLLPLIVLMLRSLHDETQQIWLLAFREVVKAATPQAVAEHCTWACLSIGDFSNSISSREVAAHMLGGIAESVQNSLPSELFSRALKFAQDPMFEVRRAISQELAYILPAVSEPPLSRALLVEEALRLVQDEVAEVKSEAFSMLAVVLPYFPDADCVAQVVPILEAEMCQSKDPKLWRILIKVICALITKLQGEIAHEPFISNTFAFIEKLSQSQDPETRSSLAKAFPELMQTFGNTAFYQANLSLAYDRLVTDTDTQVQETVVETLADTKCFLDNSAALKTTCLQLLRQPSFPEKLISRTPEIVKRLRDPEVSREATCKLTDCLSKNLSWRTKVSAIKSLQLLGEDLDTDKMPRLSTTLLDLASSAIRPVALTSLECLCLLLRRSPRAQRQVIFESLTLLQRHLLFKRRMLFIDFCEFYGQSHSRLLFKEKLIESLFAMAKDPVSDVRFYLAKALPNLRQYISSDDTDTSTQFMQVLDALIEDPSPTVARCAGASQLAFMNRSYWTKIGSAEDEYRDRLKRNEEIEEELRERLAEDEEKKRVVEKLAQKAKMDFLNSKGKLTGPVRRLSTKVLPNLDKLNGRTERRRATDGSSSKVSTPRPLAKSLTLPKML